jgi:hypothetical protein
VSIIQKTAILPPVPEADDKGPVVTVAGIRSAHTQTPGPQLGSDTLGERGLPGKKSSKRIIVVFVRDPATDILTERVGKLARGPEL